MGLSFANPLALWGLLGLPLIVAIHFLQSRNRREEVSTLFLLELLPEETRRGAVFSYLRNGLQLWMQLLAVLLFTLMLARPMWLRQESRQSVAVVLDSSVSMRAFSGELLNELKNVTGELGRSAGKTEWWLLPSDSARPAMARGVAAEDFLAALEGFEALSGPHSPREALARARELVGPEGLVLFVSDHPAEGLPAGALGLSVGRPMENSGFTGLRFADGEWQASLIHFGAAAVEKELRIEFDGTLPERRTVTLIPGAVRVVSGALPTEFAQGWLRLEADGYEWDNMMPLVPRLEKALGYRLQLRDPEMNAWAERLMQTVSGAEVSAAPVLHWRQGWPTGVVPEHAGEIWWLEGEGTGPFSLVVPVADRLTEDLNWEGFLGLPFRGFLLHPEDEVLLWMGAEPLVIRRAGARGPRLLMNFDFATSNAERFPAVLLMLHRFATEIRDQQPAVYQTQLETRQRLPFPLQEAEGLQSERLDAAGGIEMASHAGGQELRAPERPGIWTVKAGETLKLKAGVFNGDVAEGDFSGARPAALPASLRLQQRQLNSQSDFLMPLWFCLLLGVLGLAWWHER